MIGDSRTIAESPPTRGPERGSAFVVLVLVVAALTILGMALLIVAETENRIAVNERRSALSLYWAEAAARLVKRWFDHPGASSNPINPTLDAIDRDLRRIEDDGDPATAPHLQDGSTWPRYKQGIDRDGAWGDDVFERPYRGSLRDALLGTDEGPDMRIDEDSGAAAREFLARVASTLTGGEPAEPGGVRVAIKRIDIHGPPWIEVSGAWKRFGIATIQVVVQIRKTMGAGPPEVLAERSVTAVLNEIPYSVAQGALQSCGALRAPNGLDVHWGSVTALGEADVPDDFEDTMHRGIPRDPLGPARVDRLYGWGEASGAVFESMKHALEAGRADLDDPWFRFLAGGDVIDWSGLGSPQVFPVVPPPTGQDRSNLFRNVADVGCPEFDYVLWKRVATSGTSDVHYYTWAGGTAFREDGIGAPEEFETITDDTRPGREGGLFFFDTSDGAASSDADGDGIPENLTPAIRVLGIDYCARGFLYVNSAALTISASPGRSVPMTMPGEPFLDRNENGIRDDGEPYVNLNFGEITSLGAPIRASETDAYPATFGTPVFNTSGPAVVGAVAVRGIVYNSGTFDAEGMPVFYGSVIAKGGLPGLSGAPAFYMDASLRTGWPPAGWDLPRVVATRWETDP